MRTTRTHKRTARPRTRTTLLGLGATLALTLTACGGADSTPAGSAPAGAAASPAVAEGVAADRNDADLTFVKDMYPHHQGALAMAELAATRAQNAQVKDLAGRIAAGQGPELARMQVMAKAWGTELGGAAGHGGAATPKPEGGHGGGGQSGDGDTAALEKLSGAAFDREFLTRMTAHHQDAVVMSRSQLAQGSNPQAKQMAQEIINAQQAEIAEMQKLISRL